METNIARNKDIWTARVIAIAKLVASVTALCLAIHQFFH